ncbi:MAG: Glucosamine-6-phosphate deaminase 1 [Dehalococcoidia bacterium]|nr:Glucosamine-6-phosphate deaminase 1 [Chloroflexota bacterium]MBT9160091.1 Glucosamine-6-phosphate deaminase 1 [Chloroflexota bacterium]
MEIHVLESPDVLAKRVALSIALLIRNYPGRLICFAAGDTPMGMLRELVSLQQCGACNLNSMYYIALDEWVGLGYSDKGSCSQVLRDNFYDPACIEKNRFRLFDGMAEDIDAECSAMNDWIKIHGGIFLAVLGIGLNGHIGFNEPYAPDEEGCFSIKLDEMTKDISEKYFGKKMQVNTGITIGWRTLLNSENLYVLASGKHKAQIVKKAFTGELSHSIPASLLRRNENLKVVLEKEAASDL